jgi:hypothetical protein
MILIKSSHRSLSGTIVADVCAAKIPLAGIIYLCALPYIGPIMGVVGTPVVLGFVPQLQSDGVFG